MTRDSAGRVTFVSHNPSGTVDDYTDSLTYDSAGHLTFFSHNPDGSTRSVPVQDSFQEIST